MKYYLIRFTDCTDTIGTAANKTNMRKSANLYIKQWQCDCKVESITEISEQEYNSRKR